MSKKLLNAAVMPQEGTYLSKLVSKVDWVKHYNALNGETKSYIGYHETLFFINDLLGTNFMLSREQTVLEDGDVLFVCKLKYRMQDPTQKGKIVPREEDYEFYIVEYEYYMT